MTSYNNKQAIKYMEVIMLLLSPVSVWCQNGLEVWTITTRPQTSNPDKSLVIAQCYYTIRCLVFEPVKIALFNSWKSCWSSEWLCAVYSYFEKVCWKNVQATTRKYCGKFFPRFSKKFESTAEEAMEICLRTLKEGNKSRFENSSVRHSVLSISHTTFWDCRVLNFSRQLKV